MEQVLNSIKRNTRIYHFDRLVMLFLVWSVLQDFVLSFLYTLIPATGFIKFLFYLKDIMMIVLFIYGFTRIKHRNNKYFKALVFYLIWVVFEFIIGITLGGASIFNVAAAARGFVLLPCFFVIGYTIKNKDYFMKKLTRFLGVFLLVVALIGIFEYVLDIMIGTKSFWTNTIGFTKYFTDIKDQGDMLYMGLPGNFYGYSNGVFFSQKRLVSLWGGPLTSAYVLLLPLIYYFVKIINEHKGYIPFLIYFVAIILTYTRAIILISIFMILSLFIFYKRHYKLLLILIPAIGVFIGVRFNAIIDFLYDGSTIGHINNVVESFRQVNILGTGFGTFGGRSSIGTENTYLTCLGQTGILGLILYLALNLYLAKRLRIIYLLKKDNLALALYVVQLSYLITGFISEQLTASTTMMPFYIISGFYVAKYSFYQEKEAPQTSVEKTVQPSNKMVEANQ